MHLKRFSNQWSSRDKIEALIDFPLTNLDLTTRLASTATSPVQNAEPLEKRTAEDVVQSQLFNLYAVSNHFGGMGGGHYTAFCKNRVDAQWYDFDDSSVTPLRESKVVTPSAYLLFYQRSHSPTTTADSTPLIATEDLDEEMPLRPNQQELPIMPKQFAFNLNHPFPPAFDSLNGSVESQVQPLVHPPTMTENLHPHNSTSMNNSFAPITPIDANPISAEHQRPSSFVMDGDDSFDDAGWNNVSADLAATNAHHNSSPFPSPPPPLRPSNYESSPSAYSVDSASSPHNTNMEEAPDIALVTSYKWPDCAANDNVNHSNTSSSVHIHPNSLAPASTATKSDSQLTMHQSVHSHGDVSGDYVLVPESLPQESSEHSL